MDALALFNSVEAVFWITIGMMVWMRTRVSVRFQRLGRKASIWFVLFGISDIFEVFTGAWYRPLSLLLLKAACIVALIACGFAYRKRSR